MTFQHERQVADSKGQKTNVEGNYLLHVGPEETGGRWRRLSGVRDKDALPPPPRPLGGNRAKDVNTDSRRVNRRFEVCHFTEIKS